MSLFDHSQLMTFDIGIWILYGGLERARNIAPVPTCGSSIPWLLGNFSVIFDPFP